MKERNKRIKLHALGQSIDVVYTKNIFKSRKKRKRLGNVTKAQLKHVDGLCSYNDDTIYVFVTPSASIGVISHEAYHAVIRLFNYIHVEKFDEEIVAYHLGYVVDQIWNFISKLKK